MDSSPLALARDVTVTAWLRAFESPALTPHVLESTLRAIGVTPGQPFVPRVPLWDALLSEDVPREARDVFVRARDEKDGPFVVPRDVVFPGDLYPITFVFKRGGTSWPIEVEDEEELRAVSDALSDDWRRRDADGPAHELASSLLEHRMLVPRDSLASRAESFQAPGIYRLQHASVIVRTESTAIVMDPNFSYGSECWLRYVDLPAIDAVVISHSHADHFCLASLLQFPRSTRLIVPRVPRPSMLTVPMAPLLRAAGFEDVIEAPWYSTHRVGDIELDVSPFFGEQPWNTFASPSSDLRNWGNTYVVTAQSVKTWFLIDSGKEFGHTMLDECARVRERHGPIDAVFSNLRPFAWQPAQIDASGRFLYCFPEEILERPDRWPFGALITFGTSGIRELVDALMPRSFFPYAHWWQPLEDHSHVVDGRRTETQLLREIRTSAAGRRDLVTDLREWCVGDRLALEPGLAVRSIAGTVRNPIPRS